jgi:DNA mismatch repair protein MutL
LSIKILPPEVVEKIAAGEVVERPASVVKELVENSLDAGARSVNVEIASGGRDLIRVADDGAGMGPKELLLAVQHHATSKIASADDLSSISTLGFRGEALSSIGSVSRLTLVSRIPSVDAAFSLKVDGGVIGKPTATSRAPGTTVTVEDLFYNVPARRKFLRSAASETAQVINLLNQLALAYPEVRFEMVVDGRHVLSTPGLGDPEEAVLAVLGREVAASLIPVSAEITIDQFSKGVAATINGFLVDPKVNRANRSNLWLFVNRRLVKSRSLSYAIEEGYQTLIPVGRHPIAIIDIQAPPSEVDVNVHPSKSEVKLLRERRIYGGLRDAVREALGQSSSWAKQIDTVTTPASSAPQDVQPTTHLLIDAPPDQGASPSELTVAGRRLPILRLIGQVSQSYIVAEGEMGLYLIDQHAAHERVLYHRLKKAMESDSKTQYLLEPAVLELEPGQWEVTQSAKDAMEALGFVFEAFGEGAILVRGIPGELPSSEAIRVLKEALSDLSNDGIKEDWKEQMAVALSCKGAIKAGQLLKPEEMRSLLEALEEADITQHCSHGRPTAILLSHQQMAKEFGRR